MKEEVYTRGARITIFVILCICILLQVIDTSHPISGIMPLIALVLVFEELNKSEKKILELEEFINTKAQEAENKSNE